jgi:hypothetical protein
MPLDLLDKLITDLCGITEALMQMEGNLVDLATWQAFPKKNSSSRGTDPSGHRGKLSTTEMSGTHKSVC